MKVCSQCQQRYPDESAFCFIDGVGLRELDDPRIGTTVAGRYLVEDVLGAGGMATVYRARHRLVERPYALKILNSQWASDAKVRERLIREGKHAQRIAHPNIIEIHDQTETDDGAPALVMELLEGESLADAITHKKLPLARCMSIWTQMCRALARAHDFGVVHRDLKPENVFLCKGDKVKLLDFGIAFFPQDTRLTNMGEIFGTPQYMAPERLKGSDSEPPSDLYSVGVLMYEMLTRDLPYDAPSPAGWLIAHEKGPCPRVDAKAPDTPLELAELVHGLLSKEPATRPDAHETVRELRRIAQALGVPVPAEVDPQTVPPLPALTPGADQWARRMQLFDKMLVVGFKQGAPDDLKRTVELLRGKVQSLSDLRARSMEEHGKIDAIEQEGREGRFRIGAAMDVLSVDSARAREEVRAARAVVNDKRIAREAFVPKLREGHKELVTWEGRSGFVEPSQQLVDAYENMMELSAQWLRARRNEQKAEGEAAEKEKAVQEFDFQIRELRVSLDHLEKSIGERMDACRAHVVELARSADELEGELLHLASRFCAPLRSKPELGPLVHEIERDSAPTSVRRPGARA